MLKQGRIAAKLKSDELILCNQKLIVDTAL